MNLLDFIWEVIIVSLPGVISPGPLFLANLLYGSKEGFHVGIKISLGHTIVELSLIILLSLSISHISLTTFTNNDNIKSIGLVGGITIITFSILQINDILKHNVDNNLNQINNRRKKLFSVSDNIKNRPVLLGIIFSALNPFFLIWWLSVGLKLISDSISSFNIAPGILLLFFSHIWMDFVWLTFTAYLIYRGISILKSKIYNTLILVLSNILVFYGLYWIIINLPYGLS